MKFFVDTAEIAEIKELNDTGLLDGVTTNPSLIAQEGKRHHDQLRAICELVPGPVSAEVLATDAPGMVARCPGCGAVMLRLARGPGRAWLDLRGITCLQLTLPGGDG